MPDTNGGSRLLAILLTLALFRCAPPAHARATAAPELRDDVDRYVDAEMRQRGSCGDGTDGVATAIEVAIETIQTASFLNEEQKRDIFYNNAARFLRLSPEQIAKHHGR